MKKLTCICVIFVSGVISYAYSAEGKKGMPQIAFEVLQAGDVELVSSILPTKEDVYTYLKRNKEEVEKRAGKALSEEDMQRAAEKEAMKTKKKVIRQIEEIRKTIKSKGIDIGKAELSAILDKSGKPYAEVSSAAKVDIYLHIKEGDKTLVILLDDCIFGVSQRMLGDGYRVND